MSRNFLLLCFRKLVHAELHFSARALFKLPTVAVFPKPTVVTNFLIKLVRVWEGGDLDS